MAKHTGNIIYHTTSPSSWPKEQVNLRRLSFSSRAPIKNKKGYAHLSSMMSSQTPTFGEPSYKRNCLFLYKWTQKVISSKQNMVGFKYPEMSYDSYCIVTWTKSVSEHPWFWSAFPHRIFIVCKRAVYLKHYFKLFVCTFKLIWWKMLFICFYFKGDILVIVKATHTNCSNSCTCTLLMWDFSA